MKIPDPDIYFGKKIKVVFEDDVVVIGDFYSYNYDYDDDGVEFLELDMQREDGFFIGFTEDEIKKIEVIGDADEV